MRVIGTAGHVDHGKSSLVEALTGTHPDRLKEEQEREMTIDLGFAWLKLPEWARLPDADEIGIVDVPGHRDFINNMLAGVGGIDSALFVVAADEGVMPQSREHLAILDLLQVQSGVLALTKVDLVRDPEWLSLVEDEARQLLSGTALAGAPIVRVSARTGAGLEDLVQALSASLVGRPPRPDYGRPRLPVDRVFTMSGFGSVVTGTLVDGRLATGDEIELLPAGSRGRIRGLQSHQRKAEFAVPGSRTAVNVAGIDKDQITRGDWLAHPGDYRPTRRLDISARILPDAAIPVKHDMQVKLFIGAAEVLGRVRLLGLEVLRPGETGSIQVELKAPVVAVRGDRFILRRPSPGSTLGGGVVLDPHPAGRHRRFSPQVMKRFEALSAGTPRDVIVQAVEESGPVTMREVAERTGMDSEALEISVQQALAEGVLVALGPGTPELSGGTLVAGEAQWRAIRSQVLDSVDAYHQRLPLRSGMPREELRSRTRLSPSLFNAAVERLAGEGELVERGPLLGRPGHEVRLSSGQERVVQGLMSRFDGNPFTPPSVRECQEAVGEDVYAALVELDWLVPVSAEVVFRREDYDGLVEGLRRDLDGGRTITVAEFRDRYKTSRKYALAFLEHLDQAGLTVRHGDVRRLKG